MRRLLRQRRSVARTASRRARLAAALRAPLDPLSSRAIAGVFAAALATALVAVWAAASASDHFLRHEAELRFPTLLAAAVDRTEVWSAQRRVDTRAFARGARLREALAAARGEGPRPGGDEAARALLARMLERHREYAAFWLVGADGAPLAAAGRVGGSPGEIRALAARAPALRWSERRHLLLVAEPSEGAVLVAASGPELLAQDLAALPLRTEALYLASRSGAVIARAGAADARATETRPPVGRDDAVAVEETGRDDGATWVRSATSDPDLGWTFVLEEPIETGVAPVSSFARRVLAVNLAVAGLFVAVALLLARVATAPLRVVYRDARRITTAAGPADEARVVDRAFRELRARARNTRRELRKKQREVALANARLQARNDQLQRANEVLARLSITDDLTRLYNHRFFRDSLPRELKRSLRTGEPLSLVLFDIDDFKALNDRYGHAVGDAILVRVAGVMREAVREVDLLARYGGEEFALLAPGTPEDGAVALAEKVRLSVANARFSVLAPEGPQRIEVTVSAGVAAFDRDERMLFHDADRALYRAKESGKDCVILAD